MKLADVPVQFPIPFADSASGGFIRNIPETPSGQPGAASLQEGFPPATFTPVAAGGTPPFGADFNGLCKLLTQWSQWVGAGGIIQYDATQAAAIGGYPALCIIMSKTRAGRFWLSQIDDNMIDPDAGPNVNWYGWSILAYPQVGEVQWRMANDALQGWLPCNGGTIGAPGSNATLFSNLDADDIFKYLWSEFNLTQCPIFDHFGNPTTKGVSAAVDFAALKAIAVIDLVGRCPIGVDGMGRPTTGRLDGLTVVSGSRTANGSILTGPSGAAGNPIQFVTGYFYICISGGSI